MVSSMVEHPRSVTQVSDGRWVMILSVHSIIKMEPFQCSIHQAVIKKNIPKRKIFYPFAAFSDPTSFADSLAACIFGMYNTLI